MFAYMIPKQSCLVSDRQARLNQEKLDEEWRQAEAHRLLLPWPRPRKSVAPGRPSRQEKFEDAIYTALQMKRLPMGLESSTVPLWWMPGMELVRTVHNTIEEMKELSTECPGEQGAQQEAHGKEIQQEAQAEDERQEPAKKKRKKVHVPPEAREWFLEYAEYQAQKYSWPLARSLRQAKALAPELFRDVHKDTPARWKPEAKCRCASDLSSVCGLSSHIP